MRGKNQSKKQKLCKNSSKSPLITATLMLRGASPRGEAFFCFARAIFKVTILQARSRQLPLHKEAFLALLAHY